MVFDGQLWLRFIELIVCKGIVPCYVNHAIVQHEAVAWELYREDRQVHDQLYGMQQ